MLDLENLWTCNWETGTAFELHSLMCCRKALMRANYVAWTAVGPFACTPISIMHPYISVVVPVTVACLACILYLVFLLFSLNFLIDMFLHLLLCVTQAMKNQMSRSGQRLAELFTQLEKRLDQLYDIHIAKWQNDNLDNRHPDSEIASIASMFLYMYMIVRAGIYFLHSVGLHDLPLVMWNVSFVQGCVYGSTVYTGIAIYGLSPLKTIISTFLHQGEE